MNPGADAPESVVLIVADISGYTRFMTANVKTLGHSHTIITELVKTIIRQIELPMEVAKLEGDAVFLFCRKQAGTRPGLEIKQVIGDKLITFFQRFSEKIRELSLSTTCTCNACSHIEKLRSQSASNLARHLRLAAASAAPGNYFINFGLRRLRPIQTRFAMWIQVQQSPDVSASPR